MACNDFRPDELWSNKQNAERRIADDNMSMTTMKHVNKDGSYLQERQLEEMQSQRKRELSHLKVAKKKTLGKGVIDERTKLTLVEQNIGHVIPSFGAVWSDGIRRLFPEEALFLHDTCQLELYYPDSILPLSIQEAVEYFTQPHGPLTMEAYLTFSHLCRLGFLVFRHKPVEKVVRCEEGFTIKRSSEDVNASPLKLPKIETDEPIDKLKTASTSNESFAEKDWTFDFSGIKLPDVGEIGLKSVRDFGVQYHSYSSHRTRKNNCLCANWKQYKEHYCTNCKNSLKEQKGKDNQGKSLYQIGKLSLSEQITLDDLLTISRSCKRTSSSESEIKPSENQPQLFDVYKPRKNFKRSNPGPPDFTVSCGRISGPFPSLGELVDTQYLQRADNSELTYSVYDCGDINFYTLTFDNIPVDLT